MKKTNKMVMKTVVAMTTSLSLGMLVGCGSAKDASPSAGASTTEGTTIGVTTVTVAFDNNVAPYSYVNDNGEIDGFEIAALREIDKLVAEYDFEYVIVDYDAESIGVQSGKYAIGACAHLATPAREKQFLLSEPYNFYPLNLAVRSDSGITSLEQMDGMSLAPIPEQDGLRPIYNKFVEEHPDVNLTCDASSTIVSGSDQLNGVSEGRWDGVISSYNILATVMEEENIDNITIIEEPFDCGDIVMLINKDMPDLKEKVDVAIDELLHNGVMAELAVQYLGEDTITDFVD